VNRFENVHDFVLRGWRFYDRKSREWYALNPERETNPHALPRFVPSPDPRPPGG
jgi:hypothetical protein